MNNTTKSIESKMSNEEKIIHTILFQRNPKINFEIIPIDYEKLVKAISSHQLIPSFYVNIILNNLEKEFPDELIKYFKSINELNKERNNQLTKEIRELSSIFNSHKINYVFLKDVQTFGKYLS